MEDGSVGVSLIVQQLEDGDGDRDGEGEMKVMVQRRRTEDGDRPVKIQDDGEVNNQSIIGWGRLTSESAVPRRVRLR